MWLLLFAPSFAKTWTVETGDSLSGICKEVADGEVIEIDPARSVSNFQEDYCVLTGVQNVTLRSVSGSAEVGGVQVENSSGVVIKDLRVYELQSLGVAIWISDSTGTSVQHISLAGTPKEGLLVSDSPDTGVYELSRELPGAVGDQMLHVYSSDASPSTFNASDVQGTGAGARVEISGTENLKVYLNNLILQGGIADSTGYGGCLSLLAVGGTGPVVRVAGTRLQGCSAELGGGAYVESGVLTLKASEIESSDASYGGGMYVAEGASVEIDDVTFRDNTGAQGSALKVHQGSVEASRTRFRFNKTQTTAEVAPDGGAVLLEEPTRAWFQESQFCGNTVSGVGEDVGTALTARGGSDLLIERSELRGSSGGSAVVFLDQGAQAELRNLTLYENQEAVLIAAQRGAGFSLSSSLLYTGQFGYLQGSAPDYGYNAWFQVATPSELAELPSTDMVEVEPGLMSYPEALNCGTYLVPGPDSPLIDAGEPGTKDPDGTRADIGSAFFEQLPDSGEPGIDSDTGAETGEAESPLAKDLQLTGGCSRAPLSSSAVLVLGLVVLGAGRRREHGAQGGS